MSFVAIDFETATSSRDSVCAVGAVLVDVDPVTGEWDFSEPVYELVRPPGNEFDDFNILIHGITPDMTEDAEGFDRVWRRIEALIGGRLVVAHYTSFDIYVLARSATALGFIPNSLNYACTYRLAKVTWPNLYSYRLDALANELGIDLALHHHAAHDALAAAMLARSICDTNGVKSLEEASAKHGFGVGRLDGDSVQAFSNASGGKFRFRDLVPGGEVDQEGEIYEVAFAFTGTLMSMNRRTAAQRVVDAGGIAHAGPNRKTNYLVVGITDFTVVRDGMSGKMRKAVELAENGYGIEIIDEAEFLRRLP